MSKNYFHFVGVKGVGMTPLAIIAKEAGFKVTGSDIPDNFITAKALEKIGIKIYDNFSENNISNPDLVITTGAHGGVDNPEVKKAMNLGIKVISAGEALGLFMDGKIFKKNYKSISVAGTHGKTTTSAMIATIFSQNKLDPSYVVGTGFLDPLGLPGHFGKGKFFISEADEYMTDPRHDHRPRFLWQHPQIAIFTNIEFDHPDAFSDIDAVRMSFLKFAKQLNKGGSLICYGDDHQIQKLISEYKMPVISYGFSPKNNYSIEKLNISGERMFFWVKAHGKSLGEFMLNIVGEHNALNALAAFVASIEAGLSIENVKSALRIFKGTKRRLEYVGQLATGAKIYDDYAHHPTEIKKTLSALRMQFPKNKIVCIFQPHTYSRTKIFFNEFIKSLENADQIFITDIFSSSREERDPSISSKKISLALNEKRKDANYLESFDELAKKINDLNYRSNTTIVIMGAGDIYKIISMLKLKK